MGIPATERLLPENQRRLARYDGRQTANTISRLHGDDGLRKGKPIFLSLVEPYVKDRVHNPVGVAEYDYTILRFRPPGIIRFSRCIQNNK